MVRDRKRSCWYSVSGDRAVPMPVRHYALISVQFQPTRKLVPHNSKSTPPDMTGVRKPGSIRFINSPIHGQREMRTGKTPPVIRNGPGQAAIIPQPPLQKRPVPVPTARNGLCTMSFPRLRILLKIHPPTSALFLSIPEWLRRWMWSLPREPTSRYAQN